MKKLLANNRYRVWLIAVVVSVVGGVYLFIVQSSSDISLLKRAKLVSYTEDKSLILMPRWVGANELLLHGQFNLGKHAWLQNYAYDIRTGMKRPIKDLGFKNSPNYITLYQGELSPDKNWSIAPNGKGYSLSKMDGSRQIDSPNLQVQPNLSTKNGRMSRYGKTIAWLRDSKAWIELCEDKSKQGFLRIHNLSSAPIRDIPLGKVMGYKSLLGVTYDNRAIIQSRGANEDFVAIKLDDSVGRAEKITISPKFNNMADIHQMILSPDGKSFLWETVDFEGVSVFTRISDSLQHRNQKMRLTLWISDLKGEQLRSIGHERIDSPTGIYMGFFDWSPDSKRICFILADFSHAYLPGQYYVLSTN